MIKIYLTIGDKFFIPNLMHYLRSFIKGCHIFQLTRKDKPLSIQLQTRIYLNYRPLSRLSMALKVMPRLHKGHRFILCVIDEVTNYLIIAPIYQSRSEEIEAPIKKCNIKVLCTRLHYYGFGQCIHVYANELSIQEIQHHNKNCSTLQSSITISRALNQDIIQYLD